jgi:DNA-directed RNA polymerase delta subunit
MAKISKNVVDKQLREAVFEAIFTNEIQNFIKINDRQYGVLITDLNGVQRYVRIGAIVAEEREDMTAEELMQKEIDEYNAKQAKKEETAKARAEKAKKDKERREKEKKENEV